MPSTAPLETPTAQRPRRGRAAVLAASLVGAGALTLTPVGQGWSWGAPADELRWYVAGLDHPGTLVQLVGNLVLLAPAAAAAVRLWPRLGRASALVAVCLGASALVEVLQLALSLGRVVSPLDALLNATGATTAGLARRLLSRPRPHRPAPTASGSRVDDSGDCCTARRAAGAAVGRHGAERGSSPASSSRPSRPPEALEEPAGTRGVGASDGLGGSFVSGQGLQVRDGREEGGPVVLGVEDGGAGRGQVEVVAGAAAVLVAQAGPGHRAGLGVVDVDR